MTRAGCGGRAGLLGAMAVVAGLLGAPPAFAAFAPLGGSPYDMGQTYTEHLAVGDVTGDGHADVAVETTDGTNDAIGFRPWTASGAFGALQSLPVSGTSVESVAIGRFTSAAGVVVYGVGTATDAWNPVDPFPTTMTCTLASDANVHDCAPNGIYAVGDLNGDGKDDLVVANGSTVHVDLGNGTTALSGIEQIAAAGPVVGMRLAQVVGSAAPDLVVVDTPAIGPPKVEIFPGKGDGSLLTETSEVSLDAPAGTQDAAVGDFNGDGTPDIVAAGPGDGGPSSLGAVQLFTGNGSGFDAHPAFDEPNLPDHVVAADVNGDGHTDIALSATSKPAGASAFQGAADVYLGDGHGGLTPAPGSPFADPATDSEYDLAASDVDGDGHPDLILATERPGTPASTGTLSVLRNTYAALLAAGDTTVALSASSGDPSSAEITMTNTGSAPLHLSSAAVVQAATRWALTGTGTCLSQAIAPEASCVLTVRYDPTNPGADAATLHIVSDGGSVDLALQGTDTTPAPPQPGPAPTPAPEPGRPPLPTTDGLTPLPAITGGHVHDLKGRPLHLAVSANAFAKAVTQHAAKSKLHHAVKEVEAEPVGGEKAHPKAGCKPATCFGSAVSSAPAAPSPAPSVGFPLPKNQPDLQLAAGPSTLVATDRDVAYLLDKSGHQLPIYVKGVGAVYPKLSLADRPDGAISLCSPGLFGPLAGNRFGKDDPASGVMNSADNIHLPTSKRDGGAGLAGKNPDGKERKITVQNGYGFDCGAYPNDTFYDAQVLWDPYRGRYWMAAIATNQGASGNEYHGCDNSTNVCYGTWLQALRQSRRARIAIAVSRSADPRDGWNLGWFAPVKDADACPDNLCDPVPGIDFLHAGISRSDLLLSYNSGSSSFNAIADRPGYSQRTIYNHHTIAAVPVDQLVNGGCSPCGAYVLNDLPFDKPGKVLETTEMAEPAMQHDSVVPNGVDLFAGTVPAGTPGATCPDGTSPCAFAIWRLDTTKPDAEKLRTYLVPTRRYGPPPGEPVGNPTAPPVAAQKSAGTKPAPKILIDRSDFQKLVVRGNYLFGAFGDSTVSRLSTKSTVSGIRIVRALIGADGVPYAAPSGDFDLNPVAPGDPATRDPSLGAESMEVNGKNQLVVNYERVAADLFPEARYALFDAQTNTEYGSQLLKAGTAAVYAAALGFGPADYVDAAVDPADDTGIWTVTPFGDASTNPYGEYGDSRASARWVSHLLVAPEEDLGLDRLVTTHPNATTLRVQVAVHNYGDAPSAPATVRVTDGGSRTGQQAIGSIQPGGDTVVTIDLSNVTQGGLPVPTKLTATVLVAAKEYNAANDTITAAG